MSAVSSPQTKAPAPRRISMSKEKPEPRMFVAEEPVLLRLLDRDLEPLDGQRILGADVNIALLAPMA